jgi:hypothetical protein
MAVSGDGMVKERARNPFARAGRAPQTRRRGKKFFKHREEKPAQA